MDLLLPELLLMASLSLLLAFFLARLISVAAATPSPSSSEDDRRPLLRAAAADRSTSSQDDRPLLPASAGPSSCEDHGPLLHSAAGDRDAAFGTGSREAEEDEAEEPREQGKEPLEMPGRSAAPLAPLAEDKGLDDRALHDDCRWREVEIVGAGEEQEEEEEDTGLAELSSDEAAGVLEPKENEEPQEKRGIREVHVITAHEPEEEEQEHEKEIPKPAPPTEEDNVRTTTAITIAPPADEGLLSEPVQASDPRPLAEAEAESSTVPVRLVRSVVEDVRPFAADDDDDDWEGIEASELGKLFAVAASFVASPAGAEAVSKLPADIQLQLHGLHKAATEGPCFESQPMPLKIGARAKWHAWQKLGDMNPEVAMEQYIAVLSEKVPGWMVEKPIKQSIKGETNHSSEQSQPLTETERKSG